jgi:hypothetical protein
MRVLPSQFVHAFARQEFDSLGKIAAAVTRAERLGIAILPILRRSAAGCGDDQQLGREMALVL